MPLSGGSQASLILGPLVGDQFRPSALEARLLADAADGRLDRHSYLAAALVAAGTSDLRTLHRYEARADALVNQLRAMGTAVGSPLQRAQAAFEFMHGWILRGGYSVDCSDVAVALDEGRYNCVSATVLYCHLARELGLPACGVELPGHVMARLLLPEGAVDVEVTCPEWFRRGPMCRIGPPASLGRAAERGPAQTPGGGGREVSGTALIAALYYNRGVDFLVRGDYAAAVVANLRAVELDPSSDTARGNLLASVNNWAISEGAGGRFSSAATLLAAGLALEPDFSTFATNYVHVHRQWAAALRASGRWAEVAALLERAAADPILAGRISP